MLAMKGETDRPFRLPFWNGKNVSALPTRTRRKPASAALLGNVPGCLLVMMMSSALWRFRACGGRRSARLPRRPPQLKSSGCRLRP